MMAGGIPVPHQPAGEAAPGGKTGAHSASLPGLQHRLPYMQPRLGA